MMASLNGLEDVLEPLRELLQVASDPSWAGRERDEVVELIRRVLPDFRVHEVALQEGWAQAAATADVAPEVLVGASRLRNAGVP